MTQSDRLPFTEWPRIDARKTLDWARQMYDWVMANAKATDQEEQASSNLLRAMLSMEPEVFATNKVWFMTAVKFLEAVRRKP